MKHHGLQQTVALVRWPKQALANKHTNRLCVLGEDSHNTPTDQEDVARHIRRFACTLWPHRPWRAMEGGKYRAESPTKTVHMPTCCKHDQLPVSGICAFKCAAQSNLAGRRPLRQSSWRPEHSSNKGFREQPVSTINVCSRVCSAEQLCLSARGRLARVLKACCTCSPCL